MNLPIMRHVFFQDDPLLRPFAKINVGFDRLFDELNRHAADIPRLAETGFPPHNIIRQDNDYTLELAVAGFKEDELEIHVEDSRLYVRGRQEDKALPDGAEYLHKGISARAFEKIILLEEFIQVGEANLKDGLLTIQLKKIIPEEKKPRKIAITSNVTPQLTNQGETL